MTKGAPRPLRQFRRLDPDTFLFKLQIGANRPLSRNHVARIFHGIYDKHQFTGKLGTHAMRKAYAQKLWVKLDKDIVKLQHAMPHSALNSTTKYVCNFANEEINEAILSL